MALDPLQRYYSTDPAALAVLAERGLVLLDGLKQSTDLLRLARSISTVVPHRDSDPDGVTIITVGRAERVRSGFAGFSAAALDPHTDRSGVARPPGLLMTSCRQPSTTGGASVLVDGQAVYEDLAETQPNALRTFCTPQTALFGGAAGYLGSVFADGEDGQISVRLRLDDLAQFSPEVRRWLPALRDAIDRHAITIGLEQGQGYILDNHRWLHGRQAFSGHRVVYRVTGDPLPKLAIRTGFRPSGRLSRRTAA